MEFFLAITHAIKHAACYMHQTRCSVIDLHMNNVVQCSRAPPMNCFRMNEDNCGCDQCFTIHVYLDCLQSEFLRVGSLARFWRFTQKISKLGKVAKNHRS